jgi:hypothetical protein
VSVVLDVLAGVWIVGAVINGLLQYNRLDSRRGSRVSQVLFAPRGIWVRVWVLSATAGAMQLVRGSVVWPAAAGFWFGIVAWEAAVQARARIRRRRRA